MLPFSRKADPSLRVADTRRGGTRPSGTIVEQAASRKYNHKFTTAALHVDFEVEETEDERDPNRSAKSLITGGKTESPV